MPAFPTITNGFTITTGTPNVTYNQILNSLASWQYRVKEMYLYGSSLAQIANTFTFLKQATDGSSRAKPESIAANPYLYQNAYYWRFQDGEAIFDNTTFLQFQLLPNASLQLMFYVDFHNSGSSILANENAN